MTQRFRAVERRLFSNGAIGWAPGGSFDCLGPYAKVQNCPIYGTYLRLTCYATGYADTMFSIPACTRRQGKHIRGFFALDNGEICFHASDAHKDRLFQKRNK